MTKKTEAEKAKLKETLRVAREALSEIETAERIREARKLVGRAFKYRNSYSCPEKSSDYWWLYVAITRVDENGVLYGFSFQTDQFGEVKIRPNKQISSNGSLSSSYQECSDAEIEEAWSCLLKSLPKDLPRRV